MKNNMIKAAVMALCLATGATVFAEGRDHKGGGHNGHDNRGNRGHDMKRDHHENRGHKNKDRYEHKDRGHHADNRGAGPRHDLYKGRRLPADYRSRHYVVNDWRGHRLSAPPRGYHWVQTGGDYVLVSISSGIIFQVFLGG